MATYHAFATRIGSNRGISLFKVTLPAVVVEAAAALIAKTHEVVDFHWLL